MSLGVSVQGVSVQGVSVQGVSDRRGGMCPWGKCSGVTCPGGSVLSPYRFHEPLVKTIKLVEISWKQ